MKIKLVTPDKPIFRVWIDTDDYLNECLIVQADNKDHAASIVHQYHQENNTHFTRIIQNTEIDLIVEDR